MSEKSINDPLSPFPEGHVEEPHGKAAKPKHDDESAKLERFCREVHPDGEGEGEGEGEGRSAPSPDAIRAAGKAAGLSGDKIKKILALVEKFGPQVLSLIPQILALLPK